MCKRSFCQSVFVLIVDGQKNCEVPGYLSKENSSITNYHKIRFVESKYCLAVASLPAGACWHIRFWFLYCFVSAREWRMHLLLLQLLRFVSLYIMQILGTCINTEEGSGFCRKIFQKCVKKNNLKSPFKIS